MENLRCALSAVVVVLVIVVSFSNLNVLWSDILQPYCE